jgi:hypothetical protein
MKQLLQRSSLIVFLLLVCRQAMAGSFIDGIEGVHVERSSGTYYPCEDCDAVPIDYSTDCLAIKKKSDKIAHVFLRIVGANYHLCDIGENFVIRKDSLFHSDHDDVAKDQPQLKTDGIYIFKRQNNVVFKLQPESLYHHYCGIDDYINGLSIDLDSMRVPWKKGARPSKGPMDLEKYCPKR